MDHRNWYILQGSFWFNTKINGIDRFLETKVIKYDDKTKKILLKGFNDNNYEFILNWKNIDQWFITNNKINIFKEFLQKYN